MKSKPTSQAFDRVKTMRAIKSGGLSTTKGGRQCFCGSRDQRTKRSAKTRGGSEGINKDKGGKVGTANAIQQLSLTAAPDYLIIDSAWCDKDQEVYSRFRGQLSPNANANANANNRAPRSHHNMGMSGPEARCERSAARQHERKGAKMIKCRSRGAGLAGRRLDQVGARLQVHNGLASLSCNVVQHAQRLGERFVRAA